VISKNFIQKIELSDASGKSIFILKDALKHEAHIEVSGYPAGTYSVKVFTEKDIVLKKITLIH
jgi:hypothetical protein